MEQLTFDGVEPPRKPPRRKRGWRIDDTGRECARCGAYKPWDDFPRGNGPGGHFSYCWPCRRENERTKRHANPEPNRAAQRARRAADPEGYRARDRVYRAQPEAAEKHRARGRARYASNTEAARERARRYRLEHPERVAVQQLRISARRAGQDPDLIEAHFLSHNGLCDICGRPPGSTGTRARRLAIDHDHVTGRFRGLLCGSCNLAIGKFKDDPKTLAAAIDYLTRAADAKEAA